MDEPCYKRIKMKLESDRKKEKEESGHCIGFRWSKSISGC